MCMKVDQMKIEGVDQKKIEGQVWDRLRQVLDPELNINIVDIGLIYKVEVKSKKSGENSKKSKALRSAIPSDLKIYILMTLTTPGCPLAEMFDPMVRESLLGLSWDQESRASSSAKENQAIDIENDVEIQLTFDPPWVIDMMSEEARAELGME